MPRALIIEDDPALAALVRANLAEIGCDADVAPDGLIGMERFDAGTYDVVLLDIMLPGLDGLSVCERIRERSTYVPILMLTARSTERDRVEGLEIGADDYLTKPFSVAELRARVKALLRRVEALAPLSTHETRTETIVHADLVIDVPKRRVTIAGREALLTAKEFDLLTHFARHPGQVFNRAQLLDHVWGHNHEGYEHTVNSHINRLRAKIEADPAAPDYVLTVWGVGYKVRDR
ncbi:MAG: response regulator [Gammaproteobacteria bacterium]